jgi:putative hydrolase of HD superfamily
MTDTLLDSLLALLPLGRLPRTGWIQHGVPDPESIAAHAVGIAHVVLGLGPRVEPPLDVDRATVLALIHDAPEALTGDLPRPGAMLFPPGAKKTAEGAAAQMLFGPMSAHALDRYSEYTTGETREARFVLLCDRLQLGVQLLAYRRSGQRGLGDFDQVVEDLDCSEFEAAAEFREVLLQRLGELRV